MKRMKKLLAFLLAAMLLLTMIPISASAYGAQTVQNDLLSVEYTHIDSDAVAHSDITVQIQLPDGSSYENNLILDNAQRSDTLTFSVKDGTEYEIDEVISIDDCSLINTTLSSKEAKYQFNQEVGDGVHIERTATIRVILAPKFVSPEYPNDKVEGSAVSIQYYAYDHELLKMLKMAGVSVDETTKINDISFHFVNDLSPADIDRGLVNTDDTVGYLPHWYTTISDAAKKGNPENIRYLEITYTPANGEKTTAKIYSGDLAYNKISSTAYSVESNDDSLAAVAFYSQDAGATNTWTLHDLHFVERGDNFADHKMPSDPTYVGNITFVNWDHYDNGGDPFLPYEDINEDTVLYGQVLVAGYQGGTVFHVMNTNGTLIGRFLELYNAEHPENSDTDVEIKKIKVSGSNVSTNPDYTSNDWAGNSHYVVHNNSTGTTNDHVPLNDVKTVTLYGAVGAVGGNPYEVTIPISSDPGCFSLASINTAGGGGRGIVAELIINPDPTTPDKDDIDGDDDPEVPNLVAGGAVTIDCTTKNEHADATYGLIDDTYKFSAVEWTGTSEDGYYYSNITITDASEYVDTYNETTPDHKLSDEQPKDQTITLIYKDGKWTVGQNEAPIVYNVTCDDEQGGGDPGKPDGPTDEDIAAALKDIIAVTCDQIDKHDTANLTKTFTATKDNATITEPTDGVQEDSEGDYTYTITVSLTDKQRNAFIEEFDSSAEHKFKSYDPETGKLEVTLKYLPASQSEPDKGYTWAPFESSDPLTINVTCKGGDEKPEEPDEPTPPTEDDLEDDPEDPSDTAIFKGTPIVVDCITADVNHPNGNYRLLRGTYEIGDVEGNVAEGYTCDITIKAADYIYLYEETYRAHMLENEDDKEIVVPLTYDQNEEAWKLPDGFTNVTFRVTCNTTQLPGEDHYIPYPVKPEDPTDPDQTGVADLLETDDHIQYLFGYPDGSFGPDRNMTRAEAAQMFYNLLKDQDVEAASVFDDVPEGAWYATPVNVMAELGIVNGVGDDKFEPNREITRAEFTTMAMRFADVPSGGVNIFTDVAPSDWFYSYVVNSIQYGWIEGYGDGTFRPDRLITRAEVTTIVNRMLDRQADMAFVIQNRDKLTKFTDLTTEHWAYYTIVEATNEHDYKKPAIGEDWTSLKK